MTNTKNFQSDVNLLSQRYERFMVSRVVSNPRDTLLNLQVPTTLPTAYSVEISLYSLATNSLLFNFNIRSDTQNQFFSQTLSYNEVGQLRRLLFIDFSKIDFSDYALDVIPDGEVLAVFNFFADEIGNYDSRQLYITQISPSGREVELRLTPEFDTASNRTKLLEMARPQINSTYVLDAVKQMFGKVATNIPSNNTMFNFGLVTGSTSFPEGVNQSIINAVQTETNTILTASYGRVTQSIQTELNSGKKRFTDMYLRTLIENTISEVYEERRSDQLSTQFTLV